ncbi:MAG: 6-bladed beta-propeller [Acidobacteria bacterium]|nr:6-bladed beta-propeller [Acidobacteriota bacterium]
MHTRITRPWLAALPLAALAACGGDAADAPEGPAWEHAVSTEGNVTTMDNLSGSKWGGDATLAEQLSIGQMEGADEYAFGMVSGIWPTEDRVYISDARLNEARAYDLDGNFLFTIGATGQGPGEYERPAGVIGLPDGRIAVHDGQQLVVYSHDGEYEETWGSAEGGNFRFMGPGMYSVGNDGSVYLRSMIMPEGGFGMGSFSSLQFEMRQALPGELGEGIPVPSFEYEQPTEEVSMGGNMIMMPVPFTASSQSTMMPDGGFVAGVPVEYSFEIQRPDGTVTAVKKYWQPVPVSDGELTLQLAGQRIVMNGQTMEMDTSGMEIPDTKPAYTSLMATRDGRVVVTPSTLTTVKQECLDPDLGRDDIQSMDCTDSVSIADVFDNDGAFLGSFELPNGGGLGWGSYVDGDDIWMSVQDEMGTIMVKRYRLIAPRDPSDS